MSAYNRHGELFYRLAQWEQENHNCFCGQPATYLHAYSGNYYCNTDMGRVAR